MDPFESFTGLVAPLDRPNVDTDAIIPKQFLKSIKRTGFGPNLFDESRYLDHGEPGQDCGQRPANPDFVLNQKRYQGAEILLARENFGCGSSREHAPWALTGFGFRAVIAPSFADIFYGNSAKNGLLLITFKHSVIDELFAETEHTPGYRLTIELDRQQVCKPDGDAISFDFDAGIKYRLLNGLDDIDVTLESADQIRDYEQRRRRQAPWLFDAPK